MSVCYWSLCRNDFIWAMRRKRQDNAACRCVGGESHFKYLKMFPLFPRFLFILAASGSPPKFASSPPATARATDSDSASHHSSSTEAARQRQWSTDGSLCMLAAPISSLLPPCADYSSPRMPNSHPSRLMCFDVFVCLCVYVPSLPRPAPYRPIAAACCCRSSLR